MKAIVLDYSTTSVHIVHLPDTLVDDESVGMTTENIEQHLTNCGFHLSQINYMTADDSFPVYGIDNTLKCYL